jgi:hypothetical protein
MRDFVRNDDGDRPATWGLGVAWKAGDAEGEAVELEHANGADAVPGTRDPKCRGRCVPWRTLELGRGMLELGQPGRRPGWFGGSRRCAARASDQGAPFTPNSDQATPWA